MEDEIEVGEYVRTPEEGYIGKLVERIENALNYYKIDVGREIIHCDNSKDNYIYSREGFGLKHSHNIKDLIEYGDYVNGVEVQYVYGYDEDGNDLDGLGICEVDGDYAYYKYLEDITIHSIITKEQMKAIEYKIKE